MPRPSRRSRSWRIIHKKLPGGRLTIHYERRKPSAHECGRCHKPLAGTASALPYQLRKLAKTEKRPERPYGGVLCSACTRLLFKEKVRAGELHV